MNAIAKAIMARPWVESVEDNRRDGGYILVLLGGTFCYNDDPGSGTRGFDTWAEAERETRVRCIYEEVKE